MTEIQEINNLSTIPEPTADDTTAHEISSSQLKPPAEIPIEESDISEYNNNQKDENSEIKESTIIPETSETTAELIHSSDDESPEITPEPYTESETFTDPYSDPTATLNNSTSTASNPLDPVPGFHVVQATGLTDTSAPTVCKSSLPSSATPSPMLASPSLSSLSSYQNPSMDRFGNPKTPPPSKTVSDPFDPVSENPKSKIFAQRMDYMISEFFTTIFSQKIKEKLGQHWAHVTAQPEVESAAKEMDKMFEYFLKMEKVIDKQKAALENLTDVEAECSLYFQQLGFSGENEAVRDNLIGLGTAYHDICKHRQSLVSALDTFSSFIRNFRLKAVQDSLDTKTRQIAARQELDSFGSKLGQLEERKLKAYAKSVQNPHKNVDFSNPMEKELETVRVRFHEAKAKYTTLSTQVIDKSGLLQMKLSVDFSQQLNSLKLAYYNYYNMGSTVGAEEKDQSNSALKMKFGRQLISQQEPEWKKFYISYKQLKQKIKCFNNSQLQQQQNDFWSLIRQEAVKVNSFYLKQMAVYSNSISSSQLLSSSYLDFDSRCNLITDLDSTALCLMKLHRFIALNREGFRKILKKYGKWCIQNSNEQNYQNIVKMELQNISAMEFFTDNFISEKITAVSELQSKLSLPQSSSLSMESINNSLLLDDSSLLEDALVMKNHDLMKILEKACVLKSFNCVGWLIKQKISILLPMPTSLNSSLLFHHLVQKSNQEAISFLVDNLPQEIKQHLLCAKDSSGRTPLHYAALSGNCEIVNKILETFHLETNFDFKDENEQTPLFLALIKGFHNIVSAFLNFQHLNLWERCSSNSEKSIFIATSNGHSRICKILLENGAECSIYNHEGETPLHLASINGNLEIIEAIIEFFPSMININDLSFNRTPLCLASLNGNLDCVKLLLKYQADPSLADNMGLNPHEHAVFRGHFDIARLLSTLIPKYPPKPIIQNLTEGERIIERVYGQEILQNTLINMYVGSLDNRNEEPPVIFDDSFLPKNKQCMSYSLVITCKHAEFVNLDQNSLEFSLPMQGSTVDPVILTTENFKNTIINFDIYPSHEHASLQPLARATLLLASPSESLWLESKNLTGRYLVPIIASSTLKSVGKIWCEVIVVTPYQHPKMIHDPGMKRYWRQIVTKIIGHRGLGMNRPLKDNPVLQLGENTVQSFIQAGSLGAEYVEFDVQLTMDNVPVLYHDFRMHEWGVETPVSAVKLEQFLSIHPNEDPSLSSNKKSNPIKRVKSLDNVSLLEKLENLTFIKGNAKGTIQAPFATLAEALKGVPISIGFNIEVKYPNKEESETDFLCNSEINLFCDCILDQVFEYGQERNIYFSSFHPEICLLICRKQNRYPCFFLTEGGTAVRYDSRLNSLRSAVNVAKRCGCLGIVTASDPIVEAPRLVKSVRDTGLLLFTYGNLNNNLENAKIQKAYGVDAIIVDKVRLVYSGIDKD